MPYKSINFRSLGTNINISVFDENSDLILEKCKNLVEDYHKKLNFYDNNSEISKLKIGPNKLSDTLLEIISIGHKASLDKNLNTNIYMGPLVSLWDIGNQNNLPNPKQINDLLLYTKPEKVKIIDNSLILPENYSLDLGSVAKGYISDKLLELLIKENVASALINLGGNIYAHGFNLDRKDYFWHIGLKDSRNILGPNVETLLINDLCLVTSGVSQRFFYKDGSYYHHILDPKTGWPLETDMTSITILAKNGLEAEILSTGLFGKSFDQIKDTCLKHKALAYVQYKNKPAKFTRGFEKFLRRTYD